MKAASQDLRLKNPRRPRRSLARRGSNASLTREDRLIPGAEGLPVALRIIAPGLLPQPPLLQKLCAQFPHRGRRFNLNVAEKAKAFADRARGAEFPGR